MDATDSKGLTWLRHNAVWLAGALLGAAMVRLCLPERVVAMDDDFWYLRSVVETLRRGRPWTDEGLSPWAASWSVLTAVLYWIGGSFSAAVHGSLTLAGALAGAGLAGGIQARGLNGWRAVWLTALILAVPSVWFMHLMFTSVALFMGCFWMAAWMAEKRKWVGFFVFWAIGLAARQSAVAWMAVPAWLWLMEWRGGGFRWPRSRTAWALMAVMIGSLVWFALLQLGMNKTQSQKLIYATFSGAGSGASMLNAVTMAGLTLAAGWGVACLAAFWQWGPAPRAVRSGRRWFAGVALALAAMWAVDWYAGKILSTHTCYRDWLAPLVWRGGAAVLAFVAVLRPLPLRAQWAAMALAVCALLVIYRGSFDYYFNDTLFAGFLAARFPAAVDRRDVAVDRAHRYAAIFGLSVAVALTAWLGRCGTRLRVQQDRMASLNELFETARRAGKLGVNEAGEMPLARSAGGARTTTGSTKGANGKRSAAGSATPIPGTGTEGPGC